MSPVAVMSITPASPMPKVLAESCAPSSREREFVAIVIPPAVPSAPGCTVFKIALTKPSESSPRNKMSPVAVMTIAPAFPFAKVLALISAPSIKDRLPVAIVIPSDIPTAKESSGFREPT